MKLFWRSFWKFPKWSFQHEVRLVIGIRHFSNTFYDEQYCLFSFINIDFCFIYHPTSTIKLRHRMNMFKAGSWTNSLRLSFNILRFLLWGFFLWWYMQDYVLVLLSRISSKIDLDVLKSLIGNGNRIRWGAFDMNLVINW